MLQVWFEENISPTFSTQDKIDYVQLTSNSFLAIGSPVADRHLIRMLVSDISSMEATLTLLDDLGKETIICDVRDIDGVRYGFERTITSYDVDSNPVYTISAIAGITPYTIQDDIYNAHIADITYTDSEGNLVTETPAGNTTSGYATWEDRL